MAELEGKIAIMSGLGCRIIASTGSLDEVNYLRSLGGAAEFIERRTLAKPGAPIASERWAGAVNSVGSYTLANVLAQAQYRDVVTAFMWLSRMFRMSYRCCYCMAVFPAGEDVKPKNYLKNKKGLIERILKPLRDRKEPVYVMAGSNLRNYERKRHERPIIRAHTN